MRLQHYILGILVVMLTASCTSSRKATATSPSETAALTPSQVTSAQPESPWKPGDCVTAHSSLRLERGKSDITLGGTLKMKRDDVIQLNLTYIFGIQVGNLELRTDSILLVSRYTKQYAMVSYAQLSALIGKQITFTDVQRFFWGEATPADSGPVVLKYKDFETLGTDQKLPKGASLQFDLTKSKTSLDLDLSNFNRNTDWQTRTEFSQSRYTRVTLEQIVQMLMSAAQ